MSTESGPGWSWGRVAPPPAALAALRELGEIDPRVVVRDVTRTADLRAAAERLESRPRISGGLPDVELPDADVVISILPPGAANTLRPQQWAVLDVVYTPWPTPLAASALAAGCRIVSGLAVLLHQAVVQVELMTGRSAPVAQMRAAPVAAVSPPTR